ncbi:unnamed protein product [Prorocentrum cordatum]|uniref:Decapping nuclease n=1 Tax=Prorocentrum cordatum TaxID=2364126 RepID=A0ABN9TWN6_9DINO|nr:unnamed protein product [Polarella glacialis]
MSKSAIQPAQDFAAVKDVVWKPHCGLVMMFCTLLEIWAPQGGPAIVYPTKQSDLWLPAWQARSEGGADSDSDSLLLRYLAEQDQVTGFSETALNGEVIKPYRGDAACDRREDSDAGPARRARLCEMKCEAIVRTGEATEGFWLRGALPADWIQVAGALQDEQWSNAGTKALEERVFDAGAEMGHVRLRGAASRAGPATRGRRVGWAVAKKINGAGAEAMQQTLQVSKMLWQGGRLMLMFECVETDLRATVEMRLGAGLSHRRSCALTCQRPSSAKAEGDFGGHRPAVDRRGGGRARLGRADVTMVFPHKVDAKVRWGEASLEEERRGLRWPSGPEQHKMENWQQRRGGTMAVHALSDAGLVLMLYYSRDRDEVFVRIAADDQHFRQVAEMRQYQLELKAQYLSAYAPYKNDWGGRRELNYSDHCIVSHLYKTHQDHGPGGGEGGIPPARRHIPDGGQDSLNRLHSPE